MKKITFLIAVCALLVGCKYEFKDTITCPSYRAEGVMAYKYDVNTYVVLHPTPDGKHIDRNNVTQVQAEGCVVNGR